MTMPFCNCREINAQVLSGRPQDSVIAALRGRGVAVLDAKRRWKHGYRKCRIVHLLRKKDFNDLLPALEVAP
jgi:hypothetical protein